MSWWAGLLWFLSVPFAALLLGLWFPETREAFAEAARSDWKLVRGRIRHPLTRQSQPRLSAEDRPWDGWAP